MNGNAISQFIFHKYESLFGGIVHNFPKFSTTFDSFVDSIVI